MGILGLCIIQSTFQDAETERLPPTAQKRSFRKGRSFRRGGSDVSASFAMSIRSTSLVRMTSFAVNPLIEDEDCKISPVNEDEDEDDSDEDSDQEVRKPLNVQS